MSWLTTGNLNELFSQYRFSKNQNSDITQEKDTKSSKNVLVYSTLICTEYLSKLGFEQIKLRCSLHDQQIWSQTKIFGLLSKMLFKAVIFLQWRALQSRMLVNPTHLKEFWSYFLWQRAASSYMGKNAIGVNDIAFLRCYSDNLDVTCYVCNFLKI